MLSTWIPSPLHPAVVHLPVALAVLLPLVAIVAWIAIRRGARPLIAWGITVAAAAMLAAGSWVALETGEDQEDAVERVVPEQALHLHEERGEAFVAIAAGFLGLSLLGLLPRRAGAIARGVGVAGAVLVFVAGWRVGHSGGELVYRHNAAQAYATPGGTAEPDDGSPRDPAGADVSGAP